MVRALLAKGQRVIAAALDKNDAARVPDKDTEIAFFDFGRPETYAAAFDGVGKLFLMHPPQISDVKMRQIRAISPALYPTVTAICYNNIVSEGRVLFKQTPRCM